MHLHLKKIQDVLIIDGLLRSASGNFAQLTWWVDVVGAEGAVWQHHLLDVDSGFRIQVRRRVDNPGVICTAACTGAAEKVHPVVFQGCRQCLRLGLAGNR